MTDTTHDQITAAYNTYVEEHNKFTNKGVKASASRARKALNDIRKAAATRRKEITEAKNALATAK